MTSQPLDEETIFHVARRIADSEVREQYLDQICAGDQALRERVEALLDVHDKENELLRSKKQPVSTIGRSTIAEGPGHQIGRYKLLQQVGEGGFGVVYMAEQHRPLRRKVAVKIIKPGMDTAAVVARFEAERQALALMDHPNIARVLDGGATDSGRPFFVMELVKGVPVTEYCDKNRVPVRERLRLLAAICQAVQHAHQKGIIHRDLKPSNILITLHDGQPVVKIIDFGVSKALNQQLTEKTLFTAYGQMIGTPQYMSPEQAEMSGLDIDTRSDIYSLGVIMYELLTGTTPLDAERLRQTAFAELQNIICSEDAPKPSMRLSTLGAIAAQIADMRKIDLEGLRKYLRGDLDWIAMKALEKDRNRRYATPGELAADIERFLNDDAVEARPPSTLYALGKFARRNRYAVTTIVAIALSLILGLAGTSFWMLKFRAASKESELQRTAAELERQNAVAAKEDADRNRLRAEQAGTEAIVESERRRRELYFSEISLAYRLWEENHFHRVNDILRKYTEPTGENYRGFEWRYLWKVTERRRNAIAIQFGNVPSTLRYVADGSAICVGGWDGSVRLYALPEIKETVVIDESIGRQRLLPSGRATGSFLGNGHFAVSSVGYWRHDTAILRSLQGNEVELKEAHANSSFAFDKQHRIIAAASKDQPGRIFDTNDGRLIRTLPDDARTDEPLAVSADGRLLSTVQGDRISIWSIEEAKLLTQLEMQGTVTTVLFSPDGSQFAAGTEFGATKTKVWDTQDWTTLAELTEHVDAVRAVAYSANGKLLATGSRDNTIKLWETTSFRLIETLKGHSGIVNDVAFSPDGKNIASSSQDYTVVIWNIDDLPTKETSNLPEETSVTFAGERGMYLAEGRVHEFDPETGNKLRPSVQANHVVDVANGNALGEIAIASGKKIEIWRGGQRLEAGSATCEVSALAFSATTHRLAFGCRDGRVGCWDRQSKTITESTMRHPVEVSNVAVSPDEIHIASGGGAFGGDDDSIITLWDARTLRRIRPLVGHRDGIRSIVFSPDNKKVVSASLDNDIRVWDRFDSSVPATILQGHTASVRQLLFDSSGKRIVSPGGDRTVRIWDLETGVQCGFIKLSRAQGIASMQWRDDGATLVGYDFQGGIHVWRAAKD